eukprot:CAMPEP_0194309064 /NCGR_PEP_ID=MMETSP0171-20130528/6040_1 /TAXON_ID=218684 /ORGANISM="Corethron pennatum, Strain L29A3" /LENGTH=69 /DNA_ID=CAMNT_0039062043 /DNA_START=116 /DNA_END=325 /DNA_ORIENTATION=-
MSDLESCGCRRRNTSGTRGRLVASLFLVAGFFAVTVYGYKTALVIAERTAKALIRERALFASVETHGFA